jgi:hypothetical protein
MDGDAVFFMVCCLSVSHQESGPTKNRRSIRSGGLCVNRGDFLLFGPFAPHIAWFYPSKPPWDILQFLGRHPAAFLKATGIPDDEETLTKEPADATRACVINNHPDFQTEN